ncbi:NAD(P)-binding domain-containing protein [Brevibacillus sp. GCM10020057]|uniref:NAD(P)-binding domain-containing protein n=1 Tax=Brevibacillus sp. GCM10020057 TaxID=3317327 RepID=UPI00362B6235
MEQEQWGIVGTGNLGGAILTQLARVKRFIRFYHRDAHKAEAIAKAYPGQNSISREELGNLDFLILALPADQIAPFVRDLLDSGVSLADVTCINMATVLDTSELKREFPTLRWLGMKFMGHSVDLRERGGGLFVTEQNEGLWREQEKAIRLFEQIGKVVVDKEAVVAEVNQLATRAAVKAALELEQAVRAGGYRQEYAERALLSLAPEVMRAYVTGTMGHFARQIVEQMRGTDRQE